MRDAWMNSLRSKFADLEPVTRVGIILLALSLVIGVSGYIRLHGQLDLAELVADFYANVSTELGSIAITVIVIDQLNRRREERQETSRLLRHLVIQIRSKDRVTALNAVEELRENGWLQDGSLHDANLWRANLEGAVLGSASLEGADIGGANLTRAHLFGANLEGANLLDANLEGADMGGANLASANLFHANLAHARLTDTNLHGARLREANLEGVQLHNANLEGARLREANLVGVEFDHTRLNEATILPDGSNWTPDTDLRRFTDPHHPDFWRSDFRHSPAYRDAAEEA
jgi:hypothetical protein